MGGHHPSPNPPIHPLVYPHRDHPDGSYGFILTDRRPVGLAEVDPHR